MISPSSKAFTRFSKSSCLFFNTILSLLYLEISFSTEFCILLVNRSKISFTYFVASSDSPKSFEVKIVFHPFWKTLTSIILLFI